MDDSSDDVVSIDATGAARPLGAIAIQRMRARQGRFRVLPAPSHLLLMRQLASDQEPDGRHCPLAGELRTPGAVCDIVSLVGHAGWRGEFVLLDASASRSVYFADGQVVGAQSTADKERIGQVLYRYGVLSEEQVAACVDATTQGDLRFGEVAVKLGFVTREQMFHLMGKQTEEIFFSLLLASSGTFYFLESFDESVLSSRQSFSVSTLVREGVRRMHETRYFRARVPSDRYVPVAMPGRSTPEVDPLGLFPLLDGKRSIADLCRTLGQGEFEVSRAVFQLVQAGHAVVKPPRLGVVEIVDVYNRAISLILRELDAMDCGDEVRTELAAFAANAPAYGAVFGEKGPADDGTIHATSVAASLGKIGSPADAEEKLARALYDYASYALFLARPHIYRGERGNPADRKARLSQRVVALLEPLAPTEPQAAAPPRKP